MQNDIDVISLFMVAFGVLFLLLCLGSLVYYLSEYYKQIKYVKIEIKRADDWQEYVYWKKELRTLYWCLIPFVTPRVVKRVRRFFHSRRRFKANDSIASMLLPSIIGVCVCGVCLAGSTFAWFTANRSVPTQIITAANYKVEITILDFENQIIECENGIYKLGADKEYKIMLNAEGSTATTGYCALRFGNDEPYKYIYTQQFPTKENSNKAITVTVKSKNDTDLQIISQWGSCANKSEKLTDGGAYTYGEID